MDLAWTDEQVATLCRHWAEGRSAGQIASVVGCSRNAVLGKINRLGLSRSPRPKAAPRPGRFVPYSDAERQQIVDMALAGDGPTAIAKALGNGRAMNAVAGDRSYIEARRTYLARLANPAVVACAAPSSFSAELGIERVSRRGVSLARVTGIFEADL